MAKFQKKGSAELKFASKDDVLEALSTGEISMETCKKELAKFEAKGNGQELYCKVSEKGALSVYGLQRFPVTFYTEQWDRLLDGATVEMIKNFQKANKSALKTKEDKKS